MFRIKNLKSNILPLLSWLSLLTRLGLGIVFIYAGAVKLSDPKAFARIISQYDLLPSALLPVAAIGLPVLELLAGIGIILDIRGSLSLIFSLLIFFAIVLWYGVLKGLEVDCGCFSAEDLKSQAGLWQAFYRDLIMIGAALLLYISRWFQWKGRIPLLLRANLKIIV
ncbi:MAG: DoxX family membrane protein [Deltaproteobacteria bacterium]|nr:DoxX family membrane protein [Deltaproteobacteria bacterium]